MFDVINPVVQDAGFGCKDRHTYRGQGPIAFCEVGGVAPAPAPAQKLFASPVQRIRSRATGETVGYLYEWNTGERQPMWLAGRIRSVECAPLATIETA